jgi:hypothetical protein
MRRIGGVRLPSVLRTETVEHDMSAAELGVDERGFSVELGAAKQPAREQRVPTALIRRDSRCLALDQRSRMRGRSRTKRRGRSP